MATTTPDDIWTPDAGDNYALTTDLAATANTIQDALTSIRTTNGSRKGTTTERNSATAVNGDYWSDTTTGFLYRYNGTKWLIAAGQVLASMVGPTSSIGGTAGTLIGTIISTPVLESGQKFKLMANFSQFSSTSAASEVQTRWRNNASDVSYTTADGVVSSRTAGPANIVDGGRGAGAILTTTANAKVSAGIWTASANSAVYGQDGTHLWIESA